MSTTATVAIENTTQRTALTLADRCDRCSAQAFVAVALLSGGELLFCNHHYRKHEAALAPLAGAILDNSHQINAKPSSSANA